MDGVATRIGSEFCDTHGVWVGLKAFFVFVFLGGRRLGSFLIAELKFVIEGLSDGV